MTDEPAAVVLAFLKAAGEGRVEDAISMLSDDCECWFTGAGHVPRDFMADGMRALNEAAIDGAEFKVKDVVQQGDRVAIEYTGHMPLKNGKLYANHYHSKFVVKGGKIVVMREYLDAQHVAEVLTGVAPTPPSHG